MVKFRIPLNAFRKREFPEILNCHSVIGNNIDMGRN